jgi:hypothetical protein
VSPVQPKSSYGDAYKYFFLNEAKALPIPLIKKKRVVRLINGKPG